MLLFWWAPWCVWLCQGRPWAAKSWCVLHERWIRKSDNPSGKRTRKKKEGGCVKHLLGATASARPYPLPPSFMCTIGEVIQLPATASLHLSTFSGCWSLLCPQHSRLAVLGNQCWPPSCSQPVADRIKTWAPFPIWWELLDTQSPRPHHSPLALTHTEHLSLPAQGLPADADLWHTA